MEKKEKNVVRGVVISVAVVLFIVFGTLACLGVFRGFNAQGYVSAILDQTFKGDVELATDIMEGATEETLYAQYEAGVESFVKKTILQGAEVDAELEEKYVDLCKKIFAKMKYSVQEAEKVSDHEFSVPVTYQPSNVLQVFVASAADEIDRIKAKNDKIEYRGTLEEIEAKMNEEYLTNCCTLLEEACDNMEYGKEQSTVFKIVKGEDGLYKLEESAITQFLVKILGLDAKQD